LGNQFQILFPGTTYDLLDIVEKDGVPPYNSLISYYKHLSAHPTQWKLVYSLSNSRAFEMIADAHLKLMCERAVRKSIQSYNPDVVISVHPLMTNVPVLSCSKISNTTGKHLPMFTVVTDLGAAHCLWFANGVEKMFVGSEQVRELAKVRGKVPEEKLVMAGLPIRHDFAVQAEKMGDRHDAHGKQYQQLVRRELKLPFDDRMTILVSQLSTVNFLRWNENAVALYNVGFLPAILF
jgi:1,2-diacylglycerol 3-beta-galactosyltransferase